MGRLSNRSIAVLSTNGFEEVELTAPVERLKEEGATVHIVSPEADKITAWNHDHWSIEVDVDQTLANANADDYDGLVLPGGVINPDQLRVNEEAIAFVKAFLRPESLWPPSATAHNC